MEDKRFNLKDTFRGAKKNAADLMEKAKNAAVNAADRNDDGKFDKEDISVIADSIEERMKNSAKAIKENAEERSRQMELKRLQPIFFEDISASDFAMPKFIRIAERDKKRLESEVCKGSIGYFTDQKGLRIVNVFRDSVDYYGLNFYPDLCSEFYCVDPNETNRYIALNEYFDYLKAERISELQMIAKSLGAKHFKVTYKEEKASFTQTSVKSDAKADKLAGTDAQHNVSQKQYSSIEIAAELECEGHAPTLPLLKYMQKDPSIRALVAMRMDESSPLSHQRLMLKLSNTSGIKESDAVKIDAVLKSMKIAGNTSVSSEVQNESRRYLEYEIDF